MKKEYSGFSIVIANYNSGKYLEDALLSVIRQNYPAVELIVMDAGSTDNSVDIIRKYEEHIAYWVSEKDKGQSDAFNKGFAKAKNEWLLWLNADDFLCESSLYELDKAIKANPKHKWFCFDTLYSDETGKCLHSFVGPDWNNFFMKRLGPNVCSATTCFHREVLQASMGFDLDLYYAMDLDLWFQFMNLGYAYKQVHSFVYVVRFNESSKTFNEGFNTKRSQARLDQTAYLLEKNHFKVQYKWLNAFRLYKVLTGGFNRVLAECKYRGKNLIWWK